MKKDIIYSKSFKSWFGDWENDPEHSSKIVDKDGKPLVVYHGSNNKFDTFDVNMSREASDIQGIFLSSDIEESSCYGNNVRSFYVNMRNPANRSDAFKIWYKYYSQGDGKAGVKAKKDLQSMGYDGVIREDEGVYEYVVFSANQVKSINNNGNFSKKSDNIYENESNKTMNNYKQFFDKYIERTVNINNVAYQAGLVNAVKLYLENNGYQVTNNAIATGCKALINAYNDENTATGYASSYGINGTNTTRINNVLSSVFSPKKDDSSKDSKDTTPQDNFIGDLVGITMLTKSELNAMINQKIFSNAVSKVINKTKKDENSSLKVYYMGITGSDNIYDDTKEIISKRNFQKNKGQKK